MVGKARDRITAFLRERPDAGVDEIKAATGIGGWRIRRALRDVGPEIQEPSEGPTEAEEQKLPDDPAFS